MDFHNKTVLITGGTGTFGQKCVDILLQDYRPKKIIVFSRDELKQSQMQEKFQHPSLRFFIGDVRDLDRLKRAFVGVDLVIHAAALKQVPAIEYNPFEAIRTNVIGAYNVITAALDCGVEKVVALSTDKAANPINLYGASKLCSDKIFIASNSLSGSKDTQFSVVRYGNVFGSRGSVVPLFLRKRADGILPITDTRMTRFLMTIEHGVRFVLSAFDRMVGGEIYIPKLPSAYLTDVAKAVAPECRWEITGIRAGEKLHEVMVPADDARNTYELDDKFVIIPQFFTHRREDYLQAMGPKVKNCSDGFTYASDTNTQWLSIEDIRLMLANNPIEGSLLVQNAVPPSVANSLEEKLAKLTQDLDQNVSPSYDTIQPASH